MASRWPSEPEKIDFRRKQLRALVQIGTVCMDNSKLARQLASAQAKHTGGNLPTASAAEAAKDGQLEEIKRAVLAKLALDIGKDASVATERDWFLAAALTIRDRIVHRWLAVDRAIHAQGRKRVYYVSLEFLIGRLFADVLCNLG